VVLTVLGPFAVCSEIISPKMIIKNIWLYAIITCLKNYKLNNIGEATIKFTKGPWEIAIMRLTT
jgi:hypothetical protein